VGNTPNGNASKSKCVYCYCDCSGKAAQFLHWESNIPKRIPQTFYRDRFHMMNAEGGYITLRNGDPQLNNTVPTELMHGGEHFNNMSREQCCQGQRSKLVCLRIAYFSSLRMGIGRDQQDEVVDAAGSFIL
jgi:hypothetical protein